MDIYIDDRSSTWYKEELELKNGDSLRFYPRYGGYSPIQSGFSLGISAEPADQPEVQTLKDGITYYIDHEDIWYFDGHTLDIIFDEQKGEPEFVYRSEKE